MKLWHLILAFAVIIPLVFITSLPNPWDGLPWLAAIWEQTLYQWSAP